MAQNEYHVMIDRDSIRKENLEFGTHSSLLDSCKQVRAQLEALKKQLLGATINQQPIQQAKVLRCDFCGT